MLRHLKIEVVALGFLVVTIGCNNNTSQSGGTSPAVKKTENEARATSRIPNYPELYCTHAGKLQLRADIAPELSYFCRDGKPTSEMKKYRETLLANPGRSEILVLKEKTIAEEDRTEMILLWGYYVAIRPFEVKSRPLNEFIAKHIENEDTFFDGKTVRPPEQKLDHGLHLWTANMHYDMRVKASSGLVLENSRDAEYNMYQVESGNEEMGFGVESLTASANPDYYRSVMINLSFNDGTGYNDGKGGAVVMNLLHININNRGFSETAKKTIRNIGEFLAGAMYDGLSK